MMLFMQSVRTAHVSMQDKTMQLTGDLEHFQITTSQLISTKKFAIARVLFPMLERKCRCVCVCVAITNVTVCDDNSRFEWRDACYLVYPHRPLLQLRRVRQTDRAWSSFACLHNSFFASINLCFNYDCIMVSIVKCMCNSNSKLIIDDSIQTKLFQRLSVTEASMHRIEQTKWFYSIRQSMVCTSVCASESIWQWKSAFYGH